MSFPLKQRKLIRGCNAHIKAGLGCGLDVVASTGTELFSPFNGTVSTYWGNQGGNWLRLTRINGDVVEMAHLSKYVIKSGNVTAGQLVAYTGNTGSVTTGPHLHIQIFRDGKRIDPDRYNWEEDVIVPPMDYKALYEKEVSDHKETIKEKESNYQNWQTQLDRANGLQVSYDDVYSKWQGEIEARHKVEAELITCQSTPPPGDAACESKLAQIRNILG